MAAGLNTRGTVFESSNGQILIDSHTNVLVYLKKNLAKTNV